MRALFPIALGAALMLASAPAHAADEVTLRCVVDTASPAARTGVAQYVRATFETNSAKQSSDLLVPLTGAAKECAKRHGWSDGAAKAASAYGLAIIGLPVAADELRKRGVDADRISALFDELPAEIREKMPAGDMPPEFATIMQKAYDEGLLPDEEAREAVTQFMALLFIRDFSRATFLRA